MMYSFCHFFSSPGEVKEYIYLKGSVRVRKVCLSPLSPDESNAILNLATGWNQPGQILFMQCALYDMMSWEKALHFAVTKKPEHFLMSHKHRPLTRSNQSLPVFPKTRSSFSDFDLA